MRTGALVLFALMLLPAASAHPWDDSVDDVTFSLVTADPGRHIASAWFGHSGLLAETNETVRYYAYRLNIEDSPLRGLKTTFTDVSFGLYDRSWEGKLAEYTDQERAVRVAPLNLSLAEKTRLVGAIETAMDDRENPPAYRLVADNCSTRLLDLLDAALGGLPAVMHEPTGLTARELSRPYVEHDPLQGNLLYFFGGQVNDDEVTEAGSSFLPLELEASMVRHGIAGEPETVLDFPAPAEAPKHLRLVLTALAAGALLAAPMVLLGALRRRGDGDADRAMGIVLAVTGGLFFVPLLIMALSWTNLLAQHFHNNLNLLLVSPLILFWIPLGLQMARGNSERAGQGMHLTSRAQVVLAAGAIILQFRQIQNMDNVLAFMLPLLVATAWAFNSDAIPANSEPRRPADDGPALRDG